MRIRFGLVSLLVCGLIAGPALASDGILVVLNKSDHEAALVDAGTYKILAKLPTGLGPHEAATSPDGRTAYVTNYGAFNLFRTSTGARGGPGDTITVLDLVGKRVRTTFELGGFKQPHGIRTSRDGSRIWVTVEGNHAVLELDSDTGKITRQWKTGQDVSHMIVATPDESKLYVANIGSGSVTIINRETDKVKSIPTGAGAEGIAIAPDGGEVWVTNRGDNTISIIDTSTDTVVTNLPSGGSFPIRAKFTPDGKQVWVSNGQSNLVAVFDAATRRSIGKVEVGEVPVGIIITPDGRRAFVANTNANLVTVVDVAGRKVIASFSTGTEPDGMAWAETQ